MSKKDFVDNLLNTTESSGNVEAQIFLVPANEFSDKDGNFSKISMKNEGIRKVAEPSTDEFLSKLL
tara:strand:+ start:352 stop:549 length:198 start_codon:yes stop_codon:yes gene_type:complete